MWTCRTACGPFVCAIMYFSKDFLYHSIMKLLLLVHNEQSLSNSGGVKGHLEGAAGTGVNINFVQGVKYLSVTFTGSGCTVIWALMELVGVGVGGLRDPYTCYVWQLSLCLLAISFLRVCPFKSCSTVVPGGSVPSGLAPLLSAGAVQCCKPSSACLGLFFPVKVSYLEAGRRHGMFVHAHDIITQCAL